jgi:hypothetical protein
MDKQKLIDKLMSKYPELGKEPLFDALIMDIGPDSEMSEEGEMEEGGEGAPSLEIEIGPEGMGEEEESGVDEGALDDDEDARTEQEIEKAMHDSSEDPDMLKEAANSDEMPSDRLRELIKARKKMKNSK